MNPHKMTADEARLSITVLVMEDEITRSDPEWLNTQMEKLNEIIIKDDLKRTKNHETE